jgi:benzoyl-CoA reductase/2-hydroxyglutaryl-CoA dehydratase subunit BcrC/BadD/HgdB
MKLKTMEKLEQLHELNIYNIIEAKKKNKKVVGMYCLYSPAEIAVAAGAIPVPLCGTKNDPIPAAEQVLPRNFCPLIKSSYGFAVTDTCPYFHVSDFLVADTTCDGKKKMFELLKKIKPLHVLQLPQNQDPGTALPYWHAQVKKLKEIIEQEFNVEITNMDLANAIRLMNRERLALKNLQDVAKIKPSPVSGAQMLEILHKVGFFADKEEGIELIQEIVNEIRSKASQGDSPFTQNTPRILLTGVPIGLGSDKAIKIIEKCGGNATVFENCSGYKKAFTVDEDKEPIMAIAEQYLQTPCSVMSPNKGRFELISRLTQEFSIDGVIDLTWQGCHTYNVEAYSIKQFVQETLQLPYLQIETDYSESDVEQMKVRIEAFLEMIG